MTCSSTSLVQWRSPVLLHLHAPVHGSLTFRQLHLFVEHPDLHPQVIISVQLSGTGARVISLGTSFPSSDLVHPMVSGSGRVGFVSWACLHTIAWKWALAICHRAASLVGGSASWDLHRENNAARASLQPSALAALYTLEINFSTDFTVVSSRFPSPRLSYSFWWWANAFQAVFLLCPAKKDTVSQPVIAWKGRMVSILETEFFRRSRIVWIGRYLGFFDVPALDRKSVV